MIATVVVVDTIGTAVAVAFGGYYCYCFCYRLLLVVMTADTLVKVFDGVVTIANCFGCLWWW